MSGSTYISLGEIMAVKVGSIDPRKCPNEIFDLYSVPAFEHGKPDVVAGSEIGSTKQIVRPGDVLLSKIVPHIRRSWVVGVDRGRRIIASGEWIIFRSEKIDPKYLRHVLVGDVFHAKFMNTVSGVGGSLLRARPAFVAKIEVHLPPLREQRRIAAILDKAEYLRDKRREAIAKLDALAQAIFLDMFGDPVTNPKSWPTKTLAEACYCYSGGTPSKAVADYWKGTLPWFTPKDMKKEDLFDSQDHINNELVRTTSLKLLPANTVSIVVRGMILAHTFPVAVLRVPSTINQDMKALIPREPMDPQFLANCIRCQASNVLQYVSEAGHGTKRLDADGLAKISVPLVPDKLQGKYAAAITNIEIIKNAQRASLSRIESLIKAIQNQAFRGELI